MTQKKLFFYGCIILIFILFIAYGIQIVTPFSADISYLLYATNQLLHGGKYGSEIFETNPPMILYLYSPVVIFTKWTGIPIIRMMRFYILFLEFFSLSICFVLLKKLIAKSDKILFYFLFYTLLSAVILLPSFCFGQREHLLLLLMFPYLLSAACTLKNKSIHPALAIVIGVMAGIGFALKPFFLVTPCLIELYLMLKQRLFFAWLRIEPLVILSVLIIYLPSIFLFQPGYIHTVLPLIMRYYFPAMTTSWDKIILNVDVLFCFATMLGYFIYNQYDRYPALGRILQLALLGMIAAFLIPKAPWFYHVLPAFILAFLLLAHILGQSISPKNQGWNFDNLILMLGMIILLIGPLIYQYRIVNYVFHFQKLYPTNDLVNYINQQPGQHSIACLGLGTPDCFPVVTYTDSIYGERYPYFWWYNGIRALEKNPQSREVSAQLIKDKKFFIDNFADDLNQHKPRWVLIDNVHYKKIENAQFEILDYFSQNKKFREAWKHYRYLTTLDAVKIYERIS